MLPSPILSNEDLAKILYIHEEGGVDGFTPFAIDGLYPVAGGGEGMRAALEDVRTLVSAAIDEGRQRHRPVATVTRTPSTRRSRRCC